MLAGVQGAIIGGAVGGAMGAISYGIGQLFQGNPVNQTEVALLDDKIDVALGESSGDSSIPSGCPVQSDCSSSSGFSYGRSLNGQTQAHLGTDIRAEIGTPTYSTMDGEVVKINFASSGGRGGNEIVIANQRYGTTYSHLSRIDVTLGQTITRGQLIGLTGATGYVTGPHLHYGILVYGTYVPPGIFINWGR
jgi:murein DD-endopeptidase MepM/ murein hydrolase activator NlpD